MLISANQNGVERYMQYVYSQFETPIIIVEVSVVANYKFNPELLNLKPGGYVLLDYCEYESKYWDRRVTHIFGRNTEQFEYRLHGEEWAKFDEWIKNTPPLFMFKRELLQEDMSDYILPIEYPCLIPNIPIPQSLEDFNKRPIELFHFWGWSHESRRTFHGNAWIHCAQQNIALCDNLQHLNGIVNGIDANHEKVKRVWITTNIPDFARLPLASIMQVNNHSKLSLSLPGCGVKCVRHGESPVNSVLVMQEDNLAWSFPWINNVNAIKVDIGLNTQDIWGLSGKSPEIAAIEEALKMSDLYEIYLAGVENCKRYVLKNYLSDYIKPNILARL